MKLKLAMLLFLLLAATTVMAGVTVPTGAARIPDAQDFFRHPNSSKEYNELWSYQFVLDNGTKAWVNISWIPVPGKGQKLGVDLAYYSFKGKNSSVGRQYPTERMTEDKALHRISIKEEYVLEGLPGKGHRVFFSTDKGKGYFLDLTFTSAEPGAVAGDGIFLVDGRKFAYYLHIPEGRVQGRIALGSDTLSVTGTGFMEHMWQTGKAIELASHTLVFSTPAGGDILAGRVAKTPGGECFGYVLKGKSGNTQILFPALLDNGEKPFGKTGFPAQMRVQWSDGSAPLQIDISKPQQKFSILSNFDGWFERQAAKLMMGGEVIFRRGHNKSPAIDWIAAGLE